MTKLICSLTIILILKVYTFENNGHKSCHIGKTILALE